MNTSFYNINNQNFELKMNQITLDELITIHKKCDNDFIPKLSSRVKIEDYCKKLYNFSDLVSIHLSNKKSPIGLVAIYCNNLNSKESFISSICILKEYRGIGLSKILLKEAIELSKNKGMMSISLEVGKSNFAAIKLYESYGFKVLEENQLTYLMKLNE